MMSLVTTGHGDLLCDLPDQRDWNLGQVDPAAKAVARLTGHLESGAKDSLGPEFSDTREIQGKILLSLHRPVYLDVSIFEQEEPQPFVGIDRAFVERPLVVNPIGSRINVRTKRANIKEFFDSARSRRSSGLWPSHSILPHQILTSVNAEISSLRYYFRRGGECYENDNRAHALATAAAWTRARVREGVLYIPVPKPG
jgi:hypothetical protein